MKLNNPPSRLIKELSNYYKKSNYGLTDKANVAAALFTVACILEVRISFHIHTASGQGKPRLISLIKDCTDSFQKNTKYSIGVCDHGIYMCSRDFGVVYPIFINDYNSTLKKVYCEGCEVPPDIVNDLMSLSKGSLFKIDKEAEDLLVLFYDKASTEKTNLMQYLIFLFGVCDKLITVKHVKYIMKLLKHSEKTKYTIDISK